MNKRQYGNELEDIIAEDFKPIDKHAKRRRSSTGTDVDNKFCYVECKRRNTKDFIFKQSVWNKICAAVPRHSNRFPIYVTQNKTGEILITLSKNNFFKLMYGVHKDG